jgi:hypothetical protein
VHEQNLVHRDIKPSNFMLDKKGKIKLLDFGIAKNTDVTSSEYNHTRTNQNMGTAEYMSPEQIKSTKDVTLQSDIYSLGVVLWQMATGKKPYDIKTLSTFELQTKIVTEPLSKTNTNWDNFISRATAKDINERFTDCKNWLIDIKGFDTTFNGDDRTILNHSNSDELTFIEQKAKIEINIHECPRCLGKGYVDIKDIKRLKRELEWRPGPCAYCDGTGKIDNEMLESTNLDEVTLVYQKDDLNILLPASKLNKKGALKWGAVDRKGSWIVKATYQNLMLSSDLGAGLSKNGKWCIIDKHGNTLINAMYEDVLLLENTNFFAAKVNERWGIANLQGDWLLKPIIEEEPSIFIFNNQEEFVFVFVDGKYGCYNIWKKEWAIQPILDEFELGNSYSNINLIGVCPDSNGWGFMNLSGKWIIPPKFEYVWIFDNNGVAPVMLNGLWGFIDKQGNWIIEPIYEDVFEEDKLNFYPADKKGYYPVKYKNKWGFIDLKGNWIIPPQYTEVGQFSDNNLCIAKHNKKLGYIDRKGNWHILPTFDSAQTFDKRGYAVVGNKKKVGLIDLKGIWVLEPKYTSIELYDNIDLIRITLKNKSAVLDYKQNVIIEFSDEIIQINAQIYKIEQGDNFGYMNDKGVWLIEPIFELYEPELEDEENDEYEDEEYYEDEDVQNENEGNNFFLYVILIIVAIVFVLLRS